MVVNEEDVVNIMAGMEHAGGIKLNDHKRKLKNRFEICRKLGQGTYGKVQLGINKETGQKVAIKTIKKSKIETEADLIRIRREIQIMSSVQHPNIIHIYEVFENKEKMVLVMEIAAGGELYDYLSERKSLEEGEARRIFRQISTAVYYCHKHNICHRDLKLENILLDEEGGAKIADFGLSNVFDRKNLLSTFCGSPLYASPEIVRGCPYQGPEVDCWSLGVLLYTLVYGAMPFDGSNFKRLVKQITTGDYYEPKQPSSASSLIRGMLTVKAEERANIIDICSHWWINDGYTRNCLEEAEYLASLTPVRLDLLLSLTRQEKREPPDEAKSEVTTPTNKETPTIDIEEIPVDASIPAGVEECDVSLSEEPEDRSPAVSRRKQDHKRKLDERSSLTEAEMTAKKVDTRDSDDVVIPPPPTRAAIPEPMESGEDQVYERPRKMNMEDKRASVDMEKTPKVRRKHKSSGDLIVTRTPEPEKRPAPVTPKTPRTQRGFKKEAEPFERPEPQASPRPPRQTPPPIESLESEERTRLGTGIKPQDESSPPPLPEKKRKPVSSDKHEDESTRMDQTFTSEVRVKTNELLSGPMNGDLGQKTDFNTESKSEMINTQSFPNCDLVCEPSNENSAVISDVKSYKDNILEPEKASMSSLSPDIRSPVSSLSKETGIETHVTEESVSGKSSKPTEPELTPLILSSTLDTGNYPTKDTDYNCKSDNDSTIENLQTLSKSQTQISTQESETKSDRLVKPHPTKQVDVENNHHEIVPPPWVKSESSKSQICSPQPQRQETFAHESNGHATSTPVAIPKVLSAEIKVLSPDLPTFSPKLQRKTTEVHQTALINGYSNPTPKATSPKVQSPPRVSSPPPKHPSAQGSKENSKPSINNLPRLVIKPNESKPSQEREIKESTPSINNLPKLKTVTQPDPEKQSSNGLLSPKIEPPLVKPFPGKLSQPAALVKTGSPKSLINNIPKPFKSENEKSSTEISNGPVIQSPKIKMDAKILFPSVSSNQIQQSGVTSAASTPKPSPSIPQPIPSVVQPIPSLSLPSPSIVQPASSISKPTLSIPQHTSSISEPAASINQPASSMPEPIPSVPQPTPSTVPKLIPSVPKPTQPQAATAPVTDQITPKVDSLLPPIKQPAQATKSTDSVGSCVSLSSDEEHKSQRSSPVILPKPNGPNINYSTLSPSSSGSTLDSNGKKGPEKRDSKVIKAAAYWNNYIGEVTSKSKPPSNPKMMDKPKKIISAGIGERGLKELTSAFEQGKSVQPEDKFTLLRRNSKKSNVESCNPGLRVNDAKSVFEKKFQQTETPRLTRRGSSSLEKPKWGQPKESNLKSNQENDISDGGISPSKSTDSEKSDRKESTQKVIEMSPESVAAKLQISEPSSTKEKKVENKKEQKLTPAVETITKIGEDTKNNIQTDDSKPISEGGLKPSNPTTAQPKPPTSPKPKVKKEDLKIIEKNILKNVDENLGQIKNENSNLIPALSATEKDVAEKAVIVKLKENDNKPPDLKPSEKVSDLSKPPLTTVKTGEVTKIVFKNKIKHEEEKNINGMENNETSNNFKENDPPRLIIKTVKIKSPEPEKTEKVKSPEPNLNEIRSTLKKVPHVAGSRKTTENDSEKLTLEKKIESKEEKLEVNTFNTEAIETKTNLKSQSEDSRLDTSKDNDTVTSPPVKERIIPITFVNENIVPKPFKADVENIASSPKDSAQTAERNEHHIPIRVEGGLRYSSRSDHPEEDMERNEILDNFNASNISRRRWGSRKKRMSSAFSDSSVSDDDALASFAGLQKYTSYGKHGLIEQPLFRLKKTRPPFSNDKTESFSSGEEDDFDDDGFQEMTAENLFSTLLSRVKSLTRRIHDEHDEHINWQRSRHGPPKLNPGGTHARLERTAQRNSIKRSGDGYSRQSSAYDDSSSQRSFDDSPSNKSYNSGYTPTRIYNRSNSNNESDSRYSTGSPSYSTGGSIKRYDESDTASNFSNSVSVTSSQRLRPGYLPPPANHNTINASNINYPSSNSNDLDAQYFAQNLTPKASEAYERNIPISVHKSYNSDSPGSSKPGTPLPTPGVYMKHMKPFSLNSTDNYDRLESTDQSVDTGDRQRRVSRFLRPDFYEIPKEDSIYAKMKELEEEDKKKPRFLRVVQSRNRESTSGRSTPLEMGSFSEDRSRSDTRTPVLDYGDSSTPISEGGARTSYHRPLIHEHNQHSRKKHSVENTDAEQDALLAGITKLRRQGLEHSNEVSEISDGFRTPEDTESITSDIFGVPDFVAEGEDSFRERLGRSPYLSRMDDSRGADKKLTRRSISKELFDDPPTRYTSARPVARRSVSRELFDMKYNTGKTSPYTLSDYTTQTTTSPISRRTSRYSREETKDPDISEDTGVSSGYRSSYLDPDRSRSISQSRGSGSRPDSLPSRPLFSSTGRSNTQNEIYRGSPLTVGRHSEDESSLGRSYGGSLKERNRQDWRRISVPERGKDFNSLPRKYNRDSKRTFL